VPPALAPRSAASGTRRSSGVGDRAAARHILGPCSGAPRSPSGARATGDSAAARQARRDGARGSGVIGLARARTYAWRAWCDPLDYGRDVRAPDLARLGELLCEPRRDPAAILAGLDELARWKGALGPRARAGRRSTAGRQASIRSSVSEARSRRSVCGRCPAQGRARTSPSSSDSRGRRRAVGWVRTLCPPGRAGATTARAKAIPVVRSVGAGPEAGAHRPVEMASEEYDQANDRRG
jgi:hypothetical protein